MVYIKRSPDQIAFIKNAPINKIPKNHLSNLDRICKFPPAVEAIIVSINDDSNPSLDSFKFLRTAQTIIATELQNITIKIVTARMDAEADDGIMWR